MSTAPRLATREDLFARPDERLEIVAGSVVESGFTATTALSGRALVAPTLR